MAAPSSLRRWRTAAVLAACALFALLLAFVRAGRTPAPAPASNTTLPATSETAEPCGIPQLDSVRAIPEAEGPPVLLWAAGDVRLYLDGKAAFSPPEQPRHFAVGEHTLRIEAEGHDPYELRVRFEPWTPALLHAELDPEGGLTLARLEAPCVSCPPPQQPYTAIPRRSPPTAGSPLTLAASSLRANAWPEALDLLAQVPDAKRTSRLFRRLESVVYADSHSSAAVHRALSDIDDRDLRALLSVHRALVDAERTRRHAIQLARWNRTTERFSALMEGFGEKLPQAMARASERLAALSPVFEQAHAAKEALDAEEALQAAEAELLTLTHQLRATRPRDCVFQAEVVRTVTR